MAVVSMNPAIFADVQTVIPALITKASPRIGTIKGKLGCSCVVDLTFDRREWAIKGQAADGLVNIAIDHDAMRLTGVSMKQPVDLNMTWTPERILYQGTIGTLPAKLLIDWKRGTLDGELRGKAVKLIFSLETGKAEGTFGGVPDQFDLDKISGNMTGELNNTGFELNLVNLDLSDILQHVYLFLN